MVADLGSLQQLPKVVPQGLARQMATQASGSTRRVHWPVVSSMPSCRTPSPWLRMRGSWPRRSPRRARWPWPRSKQALNQARDHGTADALAHMALFQSAIFDIGEMGHVDQAAWQA
ncbi:MAG: hypothetical protein MZW92_17310 [Comamonadaceae bacterium]|nr:hypothetical protein [Comamonadaceae bacterium]